MLYEVMKVTFTRRILSKIHMEGFSNRPVRVGSLTRRLTEVRVIERPL